MILNDLNNPKWSKVYVQKVLETCQVLTLPIPLGYSFLKEVCKGVWGTKNEGLDYISLLKIKK